MSSSSPSTTPSLARSSASSLSLGYNSASSSPSPTRTSSSSTINLSRAPASAPTTPRTSSSSFFSSSSSSSSPGKDLPTSPSKRFHFLKAVNLFENLSKSDSSSNINKIDTIKEEDDHHTSSNNNNHHNNNSNNKREEAHHDIVKSPSQSLFKKFTRLVRPKAASIGDLSTLETENGKYNKTHSLYFACIKGDAATVEKIITEDDVVNYCNQAGTTPLHKATEHGSASVTQILLQHGANVNARNGDGLTPLAIAAEHMHGHVVQVLLAAGADPFIVDNYNQSPLHLAARGGSAEILEILLEHCEDKDILKHLCSQNSNGYTVLHCAVTNNNISCVSLLIKKGGTRLVNISAHEPHGTTACHLAAEYGYIDIFKKLTNCFGVDLWGKNETGKTSLHLACMNGHDDILLYLLEELNATTDYEGVIKMRTGPHYDDLKNTPLHYAVASGNPTCVQLIYDKLDITEDKPGEARKFGSVNRRVTVRLRKQHIWDAPNETNSYPLHFCCEKGFVNVLELLLSYGANVHVKNSAGETPLYLAVVRGHRECIEPLTRAGATFMEMNENRLLKFEGDMSIDAGTLEQLLDFMLNSVMNDALWKSFFITYKCFTTAVDIINLLHDRFNNSSKQEVLDRVAQMLSYWLTNHSRDFRENSDLVKIAKKIIDAMHKNPHVSHLSTQLNQLLTQKTQGPLSKRTRGHVSTINTNQLKDDNGNQLIISKSSKIAQQLSLIEYDIFYSIKKEELFHAAWNNKRKEHISPNVVFFIKRFEQVSNWVRGSILRQSKITNRVKLLTQFLKIVSKCYQLKNYASVMQIIAALESAPICRLKKTWEKVPEKHVDAYKKICVLLSAEKNYKTYREIIAETKPPCVPYIGTFLTDLTFIDEGNTDYITDGDNELINFKKFQMIAALIAKIQKFQKGGFEFTLDTSLNKYLVHAQAIMDDKQAYALSLQLEPRV